jgi:exodeoxyribonuclease VII small subunit
LFEICEEYSINNKYCNNNRSKKVTNCDNKNEIEALSFEEALIQLETIVRELEAGRIKLDDAVVAYEKGIKLKKLCEQKLVDAQLRIDKVQIDASGELVTEELES